MFNHIAVWGSIVFYFVFSYLLMSDVWSLDPEYQSTLSVLSSTALFWLTVIISVSLVVVPVFAINSLLAGVRPTITDRIQQAQRNIAHCPPQPRPRYHYQLPSNVHTSGAGSGAKFCIVKNCPDSSCQIPDLPTLDKW